MQNKNIPAKCLYLRSSESGHSGSAEFRPDNRNIMIGYRNNTKETVMEFSGNTYDRTAKRCIPAIAALLCLCINFSASAFSDGSREAAGRATASKAQKYAGAMLDDPAFRNASVSILAVTAAGDTLLDINRERYMLPASTMKLFTTALALRVLGEDYRFKTSVGYSGTITGGRLEGDLYIIGGGDPTMCGTRNETGPVFSEWLGFLKSAGIREITGYVIGDGRCFPEMPEQGSWEMDDTGTYYGAGATGLAFAENTVSFDVSPGQSPGAPLKIKPSYPETPWMRYVYSCTTGPKGSGNSLYLYTTRNSVIAEMHGTLAEDRKQTIEMTANKFPEYTCAYHFAEYLKNNGISCGKGPADLGFVFSPAEKEKGWKPEAQKNLSVLGTTMSKKLSDIVFITNMESNNLYAEAMLKTVAKAYSGEGTYGAAYLAKNSFMKKLGVGTGGLVQVDGSGLSRQNMVTADFICRLLKAMLDAPESSSYINSLPRPGYDGTLKHIMPDAPASDRMRIRMKSGTMSGVRCFSGYIMPAENSDGDAVVFSIMVNNFDAPNKKIQSKINELTEILAGYNR